MVWGTVIALGVSAYGAYMQSRAQKEAAQTQNAVSEQAITEIRRLSQLGAYEADQWLDKSEGWMMDRLQRTMAILEESEDQIGRQYEGLRQSALDRQQTMMGEIQESLAAKGLVGTTVNENARRGAYGQTQRELSNIGAQEAAAYQQSAAGRAQAYSALAGDMANFYQTRAAAEQEQRTQEADYILAAGHAGIQGIQGSLNARGGGGRPADYGNRAPWNWDLERSGLQGQALLEQATQDYLDVNRARGHDVSPQEALSMVNSYVGRGYDSEQVYRALFGGSFKNPSIDGPTGQPFGSTLTGTVWQQLNQDQ